jgi:hypothetical protein
MTRGMTEEQSRRAEQIVRRWLWAGRLSVPADRTVEQNAVGEMAVALLEQLLRDQRRSEAA